MSCCKYTSVRIAAGERSFVAINRSICSWRLSICTARSSSCQRVSARLPHPGVTIGYDLYEVKDINRAVSVNIVLGIGCPGCDCDCDCITCRRSLTDAVSIDIVLRARGGPRVVGVVGVAAGVSAMLLLNTMSPGLPKPSTTFVIPEPSRFALWILPRAFVQKSLLRAVSKAIPIGAARIEASSRRTCPVEIRTVHRATTLPSRFRPVDFPTTDNEATGGIRTCRNNIANNCFAPLRFTNRTLPLPCVQYALPPAKARSIGLGRPPNITFVIPEPLRFALWILPAGVRPVEFTPWSHQRRFPSETAMIEASSVTPEPLRFALLIVPALSPVFSVQ